MRISALNHLDHQRSLDRCLYPYLETRCITLDRISETNATLRKIAYSIATAKAAMLIPGVDVVAGAALMVAGPASKTAARAIVSYQDMLIATEKVQAALVLRCGIPLPKSKLLLSLSRPFWLEAEIAEIPAPLQWDDQVNKSELHLRSWNLKVESFGHCRPKTGKADLDGEAYEVRFEHGDKSPSKALSFLRWF